MPTLIRVKMLAAAALVAFIVALLLAAGLAPARAAQDFDAAAYYKAKCAMCHGQKAEKKFDPAKPDDDHVNTTLKGKDDVTPKMPGYEAKGVTSEQAKALVAYMKSLRQ